MNYDLILEADAGCSVIGQVVAEAIDEVVVWESKPHGTRHATVAGLGLRVYECQLDKRGCDVFKELIGFPPTTCFGISIVSNWETGFRNLLFLSIGTMLRIGGRSVLVEDVDRVLLRYEQGCLAIEHLSPVMRRYVEDLFGAGRGCARL